MGEVETERDRKRNGERERPPAKTMHEHQIQKDKKNDSRFFLYPNATASQFAALFTTLSLSH